MPDRTFSNGHGALDGGVEQLLRVGQRTLADDWTLPSKLFSDASVHELERERVFGRTWVFLGHESEIEKPGDYCLRYIADDALVLVRDEKGVVRAHFNSCRHRGMQVCRAEIGNASHFRCPYHGWTYRNTGDLIGVPAGNHAYGSGLDRSLWGLRPLPRLEIYKGLIFGSLNPAVQPLEGFLGDMAFYLDLLVDRTDGGLEVVGPPQRWIVDCNWKLAADNFIGDAYHTLMTHRSMVELGMAPQDPQFAMYGEHVTCGGHGLGLIGAPPGLPLPPYLGLPDEIVEQLERRLTPTQLEVFRRTVFIHGGVFPNLSLLNVWIAKDHMSAPIPFLTLRVWHPLGPDKMELWSWFLVERDGPDWYRQESYEAYVHTFGVAGTFEQDDAENWRSITRVSKGSMAREHYLNFQMGRGVLERDPDWPGPGEAYPLDYAEANQRAFHGLWLEHMLDDGYGNGAGAPESSTSGARRPEGATQSAKASA